MNQLKNNTFLLLLLLLFYNVSCKQTSNTESINPKSLFNSISDSTLFYYQLGWRQIMDEGYYGPAEVSYRKTLQYDSQFLLGKSVLARLTLDLEERLKLFKELQQQKLAVTGDERLVLDVYIGLTHFTNVREQTPKQARSILDSVLRLAENNMRTIIHKYPEETYLKAEYLEILHSLYGSEKTIDSLHRLVTKKQKDNWFIKGYLAGMYAELEYYEEALNLARQLEHSINNPKIPKAYVIYADIYFKKQEYALAKTYADKAVQLDSRNLDASRLKSRIDQALQAQKDRVLKE